MGEDKTNQKKKRSSSISYRPPVALQQEFERCVERSGLSTSAFLTKSWHGKILPSQIRRPPIEENILAKMLELLMNIYEAQREMNMLLQNGENNTKNELLYFRIESLLIELRNAFMRALGRKN